MGKTMDVRKLDRMGAILREYVEQKEIAGGNVCVLHCLSHFPNPFLKRILSKILCI